MLKKIKILVLSLLLASWGFQSVVMAQATILPKANEIDGPDGLFKCSNLLSTFESSGKFMTTESESDTLGCAIKTGRISLAMVPYFIKYISNYLLGMISLVALLFVVIGGFLYISGGLTESKDKGKTFIKNALIGMAIAFLAWTVVNVILSALTG